MQIWLISMITDFWFVINIENILALAVSSIFQKFSIPT